LRTFSSRVWAKAQGQAPKSTENANANRTATMMNSPEKAGWPGDGGPCHG
jgi:hypothetical protein